MEVFLFMSIKKKILFLSAGIAAIALLSGCTQVPGNEAGDKLKIVCTIFPEYDWVKQIMGDNAANADITYLLESGIDLHNYQPTADDIIKISDCDLFIYAGGESDEWVEDALEGALNKDMKVVNLLEVIGDNAKEEELKEGMQAEEEEGEEEEEYDEHVWLSLRNAKLICAEITDCLCWIDAENADKYNANLTAYSAELDALDSDFSALVNSAETRTLVFGDRFPFRYFVDDYGLDYYAAFAGCSAETEASFETVMFLAQKMDELECKTIYTLENSDKSIAHTIINSTKAKNQSIAELDSMQSVNKAQIDDGATYISLMKKNYEVLKATLE